MPKFQAKPLLLEGHRVRYEDVYSPTPEQQPEWLEEAFAVGAVFSSKGHPEPQEGLYIRNPTGSPEFVPMTSWIVQRPDGSLSGLSNEKMAADYELIL